MEHKPSRSATWNPSPQNHFTGSVWNSRISDPEEGVKLLAVQFAPGARTDWHTHPGGQLLYVVSGSGLVQTSDGVTIAISPGDVVEAAPGERHWHGASPDSPMMHLSVTSGGDTRWEESVTDEEYLRR
ncbi:MAG TPA: cupin domain-containing protein [Acidimicrobiia bacterium]|nr:cupin domain-containing protein [Acidimicrobiia bacterium]